MLLLLFVHFVWFWKLNRYNLQLAISESFTVRMIDLIKPTILPIKKIMPQNIQKEKYFIPLSLSV